jgi:MFS transporter, FHS family, glucose/mannose:H+ symporter
MLPVMAARWGLRDVQSGAFFAAEFLASTAGSIFSPHWLRRNLPLGYGSMAAGIVLLMFAERTPDASLGHATALAGFALIGLGIGLSVTATNLTVAVLAETKAGPAERARRISLVNLWWGIGAVVCPWLIATAEQRGQLRWLLAILAMAMAGMFAGLVPYWGEPELRRNGQEEAPRNSELQVLAFFAAALFLYVGVETVIGGWIPTYTHRFSSMTVARAGMMVSLFWMALLAGRWAGSVALRSVPDRVVLLAGLGGALFAVVSLVAPHSPGMVIVAVVVAGVGFGPVFPIEVSRMLGRIRDHRNTGWVFAMTACGGAVLPWLTGLVSTRTGSLRIGFIVPVAGLAAILLLAATEHALLSRAPSEGK